MKKLTPLFLIIILLFAAPLNSIAQELLLRYDGKVHKYSGAIYKLQVNGETVSTDIPPIIINNRSLVPARAVFEKLGASVQWESSSQKVLVSLGGTAIELKINSTTAMVNNKAVTLDVPAKIINDRTMVPVRFVGEQLGNTVGWYPDKSLITLDSKSPVTPGTINDIKYSFRENNLDVAININNYSKFETMTLSNPDRIVVDISNAKISGSQPRIDISSNTVKSIRQGQVDPNTARVVFDVVGQPKYQVLTKDSQILVSFEGKPGLTDRGVFERDSSDMKNSIDVKCASKTGYDEVIIYAENYSNYYITPLNNSSQLMVHIPGASAPSEPQVSVFNGSFVHSTNYSLNNNSAVVFINLIGQTQYKVVEEKGMLILQIMNAEAPGGSQQPGGGGTSVIESGFEIKHGQVGGQDEVSVLIKDYKNYTVSTVQNPHRIIVDIPYSSGPKSQQKVDINSRLVSSVRYAQFNKDTLRVVLDVTGQPEYEVLEQNGQLTVRVKSCRLINLDYRNSGDRVALILDKAKLTEGGETLKKLYTERYDSTGTKYTITFPSNLANLESELVAINDNILNSIEISKNGTQTSITFNAKDKFLYHVFTRSGVNNTAITILKPAARGERLVVIDPGHGGSEPGAVHAGVFEKDLNLDISKRLNELLKSKNIKTYMIRDDDSYVALYERAYIANNMNAALFLSIHNNAYYAAFKGTETLYYLSGADNGGLNSKRFAQIIQSRLVNALGTVDRKIVHRPNLVVLKGTIMPAALAEIGFITNDEDRANLLREDFRQKAAQALCDSIIQSLNELK